MTDKERVNKLNNLIGGLADQGVLLTEEILRWSEIMSDPVIEVFTISTTYVDNLDTQVREMWINHEEETINIFAHTEYIYNMTLNELETVINFNDIVDYAITLRANGNTTLTIDTGDDIEDFYFENQDEGLAVYQIIAKKLVNRR